MRVKICGLTEVDTAVHAVKAGADAIGLVFYAPSSRYVSNQIAAEIARAVGPFVTIVGLFVDASQQSIEDVIREVPLSLLQFHGNESPDFCQQFTRPYIKAIRMRADVDIEHEIKRYSSASGLLLDAYIPGIPGGTGETFDWQHFPKVAPLPLILAGGLHADNVAEAIQKTRPYAVDVSGGVESSPGMKDAKKITAFITNAKKA